MTVPTAAAVVISCTGSRCANAPIASSSAPIPPSTSQPTVAEPRATASSCASCTSACTAPESAKIHAAAARENDEPAV